MSRDLDPDLQALLDAGSCRQVFTLDVQLNDGTELHLATAPETVGDVLYSPVLKEPGVLRLSLFADDDSQGVKVSNVDYEFGQTLTGATNVLDGARATSGVLFLDDSTGDQWWDERLPGGLLAGEVTEEVVSFDLVDELYATTVAGERVVDIHPFRQPPAPGVRPDPNDNDPGGFTPGGGWPGGPGGGGFEPGERPNRFPLPVDIF